MIIKEKSDAARKLEKQLSDVIQSETTSNKFIERIFVLAKEKLIYFQASNNFESF